MPAWTDDRDETYDAYDDYHRCEGCEQTVHIDDMRNMGDVLFCIGCCEQMEAEIAACDHEFEMIKNPADGLDYGCSKCTGLFTREFVGAIAHAADMLARGSIFEHIQADKYGARS